MPQCQVNFSIYPSSLGDKVFRRIKDLLNGKNMLSQYGVYDGYKTFLEIFTGLELEEV